MIGARQNTATRAAGLRAALRHAALAAGMLLVSVQAAAAQTAPAQAVSGQAASGQAAPAPAVLAQSQDWAVRQLGRGIALRVGKTLIGKDQVEVAFARVEAGSGQVRVFTPRSAFDQRGSKVERLKSAIPDGLAMRDFAGLTGAVAVLAGGYVSSFSPVQPLGYVRSGSQVSSRVHRSWLVDAMLCANWRDFELGPFDELYQKRDSYADCLQIGPMVLLDGKRSFGGDRLPSAATKLLKARQRQGFVCRDDKGALLIGVSSEVPLDDFIPFLAKSTAQGGLGCQTAARVTGSTTATLATPKDVFGPDKYLLPTAIAILPGR